MAISSNMCNMTNIDKTAETVDILLTNIDILLKYLRYFFLLEITAFLYTFLVSGVFINSFGASNFLVSFNKMLSFKTALNPQN